MAVTIKKAKLVGRDWSTGTDQYLADLVSDEAFGGTLDLANVPGFSDDDVIIEGSTLTDPDMVYVCTEGGAEATFEAKYSGGGGAYIIDLTNASSSNISITALVDDGGFYVAGENTMFPAATLTLCVPANSYAILDAGGDDIIVDSGTAATVEMYDGFGYLSATASGAVTIDIDGGR